jgi:hypothetical protein
MGPPLQKYPFAGNLVLATAPKLTGWEMESASSYYRREIYARPEAGEGFSCAAPYIKGGAGTRSLFRQAISSLFGFW